jgi:glycosyltransferase involved in cell wall biosynthesis
MNVLHIAAQLNYCGANKELAALAVDQQAQGHRVRVCCLGPRGPWTGRLEAAGVDVESLGWSRWFDIEPPRRLRDLLGHADIEAVQLWGSIALRCVGLLKPTLLSRAIVSPPLPHDRHLLDRWLLRRAGRIVVRDETEKNRALALGVALKTVVVVPPGIGEASATSPAAVEPKRIAGIGPLEKTKNFRDAVWSMDILNEIFPELELELVGQGSQRAALVEFSSRFRNTRLHLLGARDDVPIQLAGAALCWLPALAGCRHAALDALAAGRPIVASDLPHLRALIPDGEAGFLVPAGDKIALARKTRTLILDPDLRIRMGLAGQRHVRARFSERAYLQRWRDVLRAA